MSQCSYMYTRDMPDTTLPDTGFNWIVIYQIYWILEVASLNIRFRQ